mgnify:CR=1 FL=1
MKYDTILTLSKLAELKLEIIRSVINTESVALLTLLKSQIANFEKGQAEVEKTQIKTVKKARALKKQVYKTNKN